jgi:GDPmannose 4,6-dehydratase
MQWLMLQQDTPDDYVIGTGKQYSVREFINVAAQKLDISLEWTGQGIDEQGITADGNVIVAVDSAYFRPTEVETLLADPSKAKRKLGWEAKISFDAMVQEMVEKDLEQAQKDSLCKEHGFSTFTYQE